MRWPNIAAETTAKSSLGMTLVPDTVNEASFGAGCWTDAAGPSPHFAVLSTMTGFGRTSINQHSTAQ